MISPKTTVTSDSFMITPTNERSWLVVRGARQNNLKNIDVPFPLGAFTVVTGVSGSGKSSLVNDILWKSLSRTLHRAQTIPGAHDSLEGVEFLNKVIRVDQQPIGQTPTSNPATYTGVFDLIRELFAQLPDSKLRGYSPRRFSFNVPGGRCEKCEGAGQIKIEMHFLPDVWILCDSCNGKRYERQTLEVKFHGYSIADVLEMSCAEALQLFGNIPAIRRVLQTLCDVGLDYLSLGQAAPTLSGGEAQRVKLAAELARPDTGRTLYLLDEPTTGLHFDDLLKLLEVLHRLVDCGNTVIVIEHNLDVIKNADWIVDLGPEAGAAGGFLIFAGTPEELIQNAENQKENLNLTANTQKYSKKQNSSKNDKKSNKQNTKQSQQSPTKSQTQKYSVSHTSFFSYTAQALRPVFEAGQFVEREVFDPARLHEMKAGDLSPREIGATTKMPWETDGVRWHTKNRISRTGQPIHWNGKILAEVVQRIEATGHFAPTNWNDRSVVKINAEKKSLGWFFHAITSDEWLLKMKFRTAQNTFRKEMLKTKLDLKPLNNMNSIPLYGNEPRVRVHRSQGRWQEIELRVHSWEEVDRKEFWDFLDSAIKEFAKYTKKVEKNPNNLMPWKILGEKWHSLPKGLIGGDKLLWEPSLLTELFGMLKEIAPQSRIVWTNKVLVPFYQPRSKHRTEEAKKLEKKLEIDGRPVPWLVVHTKRVDAVYLDLYVIKNSVPLGRIRSIGNDPFVSGKNKLFDVIQLKLTKKSEIRTLEFQQLLRETLKNDE
ncbi:MAG: ATP-binding cassette domain-containing protein [Planctomycetaceae bacterium]|nr:ATP-binding cassette domain-containing protein [Planctomycetaceae bacterium]